MTGVTRQRAEHEGNPSGQFDETHTGYMRMRDETGPRSSKDKGSEGHARNSALCAPEGAREMGTETENEETANCLGTRTEGGGEKIRVSIGNGHLGRESEAGRAASERRTAKTKALAERQRG